jgi:aspartate/methionine/tyrosine aminotransferase
MEARRWLDETTLPPDLPLLNLSQAAPVDPPPPTLRAAMARAVEQDPAVHLYGPVLGHDALRGALAGRTAAIYGGSVAAGQVAITSGCNQAFCASGRQPRRGRRRGDPAEPVVLQPRHVAEPAGDRGVPLPTGADLLPDPDRCAALITPRTRAITLVTPNNPGGVEYPAGLIADFADLAARHGIALILDETYRDFHAQDGPPHGLFADPGWDRVLIHLYSFSKAYRLTGHRVGAILAAPDRLAQIEKVLDTVTICPSGPGQMGALWGIENLDEWLAGERAEILRRRASIAEGLARLPGWEVTGCGAYFAYVRHPFDAPSPEVAKRLLREAGVLMLPGTMFRPEGAAEGARELRIAFANADSGQIDDLLTRLASLR